MTLSAITVKRILKTSKSLIHNELRTAEYWLAI